jgi:hypothetical protein
MKDSDYLAFLELLEKPMDHLPSAEVQLERKEAEKAAALGVWCVVVLVACIIYSSQLF